MTIGGEASREDDLHRGAARISARWYYSVVSRVRNDRHDGIKPVWGGSPQRGCKGQSPLPGRGQRPRLPNRAPKAPYSRHPATTNSPRPECPPA
jgi:hypothetical protein